MSLVEFVSVLFQPGGVDKLIAGRLPGIHLDQIDAYMRPDLSLDSEVSFYDAETIPNQLEIRIGGACYINLMPLHMVREFVNDYRSLSPDAKILDTARILLDYRINDA